jgi:hypothetical protein
VPKFNCDNLSPQDCEEVVRDLLQADWNIILESFREGRDSGIDLRYAAAHDATTIVQCKRYGRSGYTKLLNREHVLTGALQASERLGKLCTGGCASGK